MKSFITGGAGFIGSRLAERLSNRGRIICYDNLSSGLRENTAFLSEGDICNHDRLVYKMKMDRYDAVFHLAANTNTRAGMTNSLDLFNGLIGTHNVLLAMKAAGIKKLVFSSTCGVYGDAPGSMGEDDKLNPICPYAEHKLNAELLIRDFCEKNDMQAWIFRFGNVVGGRMQNGVIRDLVLKLKEDKTKLDVLGSKKPSRPFLCVDDCVDAILFAFDNTDGGTFNIAGSGSTNIGQIVKMLLNEINREIPVNYEIQDRGWEGSATQVCISTQKLKDLGWEASMSSNTAVKKAIKEIIEFNGLVWG